VARRTHVALALRERGLVRTGAQAATAAAAAPAITALRRDVVQQLCLQQLQPRGHFSVVPRPVRASAGDILRQ